MNRRLFSKPATGFTLVELLVTVSIIAVIIALLLPVIGKAREQSRAAGCINNLKTYGNAVFAFIADNGGMLPDRSENVPDPPPLRYGAWVAPYLGRPLREMRCPSSEEERKRGGFTYSGNGGLTVWFPRLNSIPAPISRVVLAAEMYASLDGFWVYGHFNRVIWGNGTGSSDPAEEGSARTPQYHGNKVERGLHFFFLDGHIKRVSAPKNDFSNSPTLGDATNGGYFYTTGQLSSLYRRTMIVQ